MRKLIVFSHLRWDFVYQRPQHLLSRLAERYPVIYVEEPVRDAGPERLECVTVAPNVEVLRPHTQVDAAGFHDDQLSVLKPMLAEYLEEHLVDDYLVWFYTPMALPLLAELQPRAVVYDCMDELSAFKGAPRQMQQREAALLKSVDVVFAGGLSLHAAKQALHPNVLCIPSAVDVQHYAPAKAMRHLDRVREAQLLQRDVGFPRLGFFGVIDERLDIDLLRGLARARPDWHIVMVGPVVKIDPAALPQEPNIHWLGMQSYDLLPQLVGTWDICLLPFAQNESTRFISPTKTLEYMAAEKPVVSTPVHDVVTMYSDVVEIGSCKAGFVEACERLLNETAASRASRVSGMSNHVMSFSWDEAARTIENALDALSEQEASLRRHGNQTTKAGMHDTHQDSNDHALSAARSPASEARSRVRQGRQIVVGAGPTGLSAAYHLGLDQRGQGALLVERQPTVGGWCRSVQDKGFTFDYAGHIMFSNDPYVLSLYDKLLGDNLHWQNREAWIYSKNVYTRYPFQGSLYGLPADVLKECLLGAIEARLAAAQQGEDAPKPAHFKDFIYQNWGAGIAKHFAIPYNEKLWAVPLDEMETSWLGGRVPMPDLAQMIDGALKPSTPPMGPNARFGYPLRGGFQALMDAFKPHLNCELALNTGLVSVSPRKRTAHLDDGRILQYETLISTIPLPALVAACGDEAPARIQAAARALRHVSVRCVNLGVAREAITDKHWIYYPEDTVFHRIFVQGNASPHCNAPGGFGLTCEITYSASKPLPCEGQALIDLVVDDCRRVGMLRADDQLITAKQVDMPCAYVVYDHARAENVREIREWLASADIILAGRYSEWEYYNSDHAFVAGKKAAEQALAKSLPWLAETG